MESDGITHSSQSTSPPSSPNVFHPGFSDPLHTPTRTHFRPRIPSFNGDLSAPFQPSFGSHATPHTPAKTPHTSAQSPDFTLGMTGLADPLSAKGGRTAGFRLGSPVESALAPRPLSPKQQTPKQRIPKRAPHSDPFPAPLRLVDTHASNLVFPSYKPEEPLERPRPSADAARTPRPLHGLDGITPKPTYTPIESDYFADQEATSDDNRLGSPFADAARVAGSPKTSLQQQQATGPAIRSALGRPLSPRNGPQRVRKSGDSARRKRTSHRRATSEGQTTVSDKSDNLEGLFGARNLFMDTGNILGIAPISVFSVFENASPEQRLVAGSISSATDTSSSLLPPPPSLLQDRHTPSPPIPYATPTSDPSRRHLSLPSPRIPAISPAPERVGKKRKSTDELDAVETPPTHSFARSISTPMPRSILKSNPSPNTSGKQLYLRRI